MKGEATELPFAFRETLKRRTANLHYNHCGEAFVSTPVAVWATGSFVDHSGLRDF